MRKYKTCVAIILVLAAILSVCACNSKNTDEAKVVCFSFCDAVRSGDTAKLAKYFNDPAMAEAALSGLNAVQDMNSEQAEYYEVIRNSLIYSVEEPVYNAKDNTATVVTVWCVGNYNSDAARAAKNIKIHKIRLSGFNKSFRFAERKGTGRVEVEPVSGWKVTQIYKNKMFDGNSKKLYYNNGDKVTLNKFDQLGICLENTKTKKETWYIYHATI